MSTDVAIDGQSVSCGEANPDLCRACLDRPACARVLRLLYTRSTTLMALPDIAAGSGLTEKEACVAIARLDRMGFLRRVTLGDGLTFYGMTEDDRELEDARGFHSWCAEQRQHWDAVRDVIG
jgi:hypothetical protein